MVGQLETAHSILQGPGERTPHMSEELTFEQLFGDRAAVDLDHRPSAPFASVVNGSGDQLLSGARLTQYQYAAVGRCDHLDLLEDLPEWRTRSYDVSKGVRGPDLLEKIRVFQLDLFF